jgi:hypothetical protein
MTGRKQRVESVNKLGAQLFYMSKTRTTLSRHGEPHDSRLRIRTYLDT